MTTKIPTFDELKEQHNEKDQDALQTLRSAIIEKINHDVMKLVNGEKIYFHLDKNQLHLVKKIIQELDEAGYNARYNKRTQMGHGDDDIVDVIEIIGKVDGGRCRKHPI